MVTKTLVSLLIFGKSYETYKCTFWSGVIEKKRPKINQKSIKTEKRQKVSKIAHFYSISTQNGRDSENHGFKTEQHLQKNAIIEQFYSISTQNGRELRTFNTGRARIGKNRAISFNFNTGRARI